MIDRLRSMRRVLAVQDQLKRMAEWRLTSAETRKRELEAEARQLDSFIDQSSLADPLALVAMHHRRRVAGQEVATAEEVEQEREATTQARSLHRLAERMIDTLDTELERHAERRDLERMIDDLAARDPASDASLP